MKYVKCHKSRKKSCFMYFILSGWTDYMCLIYASSYEAFHKIVNFVFPSLDKYIPFSLLDIFNMDYPVTLFHEYFSDCLTPLVTYNRCYSTEITIKIAFYLVLYVLRNWQNPNNLLSFPQQYVFDRYLLKKYLWHCLLIIFS